MLGLWGAGLAHAGRGPFPGRHAETRRAAAATPRGKRIVSVIGLQNEETRAPGKTAGGREAPVSTGGRRRYDPERSPSGPALRPCNAASRAGNGGETGSRRVDQERSEPRR